MRHQKAIVLVATIALGLVARGAQAGSGVVIDPSQLPGRARISLAESIAKARVSHPEAFDQVARAPAMAVQLTRQARGQRGSITLALKALGPGALLPMLNMLAVDGPGRGALDDAAWLALRVGLLEAVGMRRDSRSVAVLAAILDQSPPEPEIDRAAAQALARFGSDEAAAKLIALAGTPGPKRLAVLAGIGDCRRAVVAAALRDLLTAQPPPEEAGLIARSLGKVGNSWAWRTPVVAASGEGPQTRATAAEALMHAFVHYEGQARRLAGKALLVVDDPSTPALVASAQRGAAAPLAADLDRLAQRFAKNPLRRP